MQISSRTTQSKVAVVELLKHTPRPITLQDIHSAIVKTLPQTAFSTVFRIVRNLAQEGLVTQADWRERGSVYEWSDRPHHHHLICESCDHIEDVHGCAVETQSIENKTGFAVQHHSMELFGVCAPCQKKGN